MRRLLFVGAAAAGAAAVGFYYKVRPWWKSWGVDPAEAGIDLPGDDLVPTPVVTDTRGITIDAPPSAVWPWLVQMGYERAGWYSYDQLDMKGRSADTVNPEWQAIEVGGTMPTHPGGGFLIKEIEPERALVLYLDNDIVESWRKVDGEDPEMPTRGLAFAGAMGERSMPGAFNATWAFVLKPIDDGRTRLIERLRVAFEETPGSRISQPFMGFGVFVMLQRQMEGIRERAEALARGQGTAHATSDEPRSKAAADASPPVEPPAVAETPA